MPKSTIETYQAGTDEPVLLETIEVEAPEKPLSIRLDNLFKSQSEDIQAQFWGLRTAIKDALSENPKVAKLIIEKTSVPEELQAVKQALLDEFLGE